VGTGIGGIATYTSCEGTHLLSGLTRKLEELRGSLDEAAAATLDRIVEGVRFLPRFNPFAVARCMPNACSAAIGIRFSAHGPSATPCRACASGTVAIGHAFREIRDGTLDLSICGASEFLGDRYGGVFRGFDVAKTLLTVDGDPRAANRPFDRDRSGFLFSEGGSGILILEELEHARRRGARIYAEIRGFAETFDAFTVMGMDPEGVQIERLVRTALAASSLPPAAIDYINAHGTGTEVNDDTESAVIERVFGDKPLVTATKSLTGHGIGASGAIEGIVTALSLYHQTTHACRNLDTPVRDLSFVREAGPCTIHTALSQSFAFGGHNAAVVMVKNEE
jgi:3-oxoacyl-[acyl-carrier-protein] synthase II